MTEPVEGDQRELLLRGLSLVVSKNGVVERLIGCAVIHQLSVILNEDPFLSLPVVAHLPDKFLSLGFQGLEPFCQEVGDCHSALGGPCLGAFDCGLSVDHSDRFCDTDGILVEVNVPPFQGEQFPFPKAGVDCQVEEQADLFWKVFGQGVVSHVIGLSSVIDTVVAANRYGVRGFYVLQKLDGLLRGEEFELFSWVHSLEANFVAGIGFNEFPLHRSTQQGGQDVSCFVDAPLAVASWLPVLSGSVLGKGYKERVDNVRL